MTYTTYHLVFGVKVSNEMLANIIGRFYDLNVNHVQMHYKGWEDCKKKYNSECHNFGQFVIDEDSVDVFLGHVFDNILYSDMYLYNEIYDGDVFFGVEVWSTNDVNWNDYEVAKPIVTRLSEEEEISIKKRISESLECCNDILPEINYYWCSGSS